ncbi:hypothetical protein [Planktotalea arctica]|uniref:hypothetical protein n=1 Tax=Planktotalea arctica TaxID=1481893 RepID=UPI0032193EB8
MFGLFNKRTESTNNYSLQNDYKSTSINSDDRVAADGGAIVTRGNVSILDGDAIDSSFEFANTLAQLSSDETEVALGFAQNAFDAAHQAVTGQSQRVLTIAETAMERDRVESAKLSEKAMQIAVPLGLAFAAAWAWRGMK